MHRLGYEAIHTCWDNALPPRLTIRPGETVIFATREPSQGQVARDVAEGRAVVTAAPEVVALARRDAAVPAASGPGTDQRGHALTGPVAITGAEQGDTLVVGVVSIVPSDWGWTAAGPGAGSPLSGELSERYLHLWDLRAGTHAVFAPGIRVPMAPFCGVMGVAPAEAGRHRTTPPGCHGGNMDIRQLTAGATLFLPVLVPGALFSVGDAHAAQGDGEVSGTAIEMDATITLRFDLQKGRSIPSPCLRAAELRAPAGPWFAATGHDADLLAAIRQALRGIVAYLGDEHGLMPSPAMTLASACVDLKISQVVNGGVFTVSAFLPLSIFSE